MAFGVSGSIVVAFLVSAFNVLVNVWNGVTTFLQRHLFLAVLLTFLANWAFMWFLTSYFLDIMKALLEMIGLESATIAISDFWNKILEALPQISRYETNSFIYVGYQLLELVNVSFLLALIKNVIIPMKITQFVYYRFWARATDNLKYVRASSLGGGY